MKPSKQDQRGPAITSGKGNVEDAVNDVVGLAVNGEPAEGLEGKHVALPVLLVINGEIKVPARVCLGLLRLRVVLGPGPGAPPKHGLELDQGSRDVVDVPLDLHQCQDLAGLVLWIRRRDDDQLIDFKARAHREVGQEDKGDVGELRLPRSQVWKDVLLHDLEG